MYRLSSAFFSFLVILSMMISCGETESKKSKSSTQHLESRNLKFALDYDSSWLITFKPDSSQSGALTILQSGLEGPDDSYQERIEIYHEGLPMRIPDTMFHQAAITQIKISNPSLEVTNVGAKPFGNNHFHEYTFSFNRNSTDYVVHGYTLLNDSIGYTINFTAAKKDENKYLSKVENILSSFKPVEQ